VAPRRLSLPSRLRWGEGTGTGAGTGTGTGCRHRHRHGRRASTEREGVGAAELGCNGYHRRGRLGLCGAEPCRARSPSGEAQPEIQRHRYRHQHWHQHRHRHQHRHWHRHRRRRCTASDPAVPGGPFPEPGLPEGRSAEEWGRAADVTSGAPPPAHPKRHPQHFPLWKSWKALCSGGARKGVRRRDAHSAVQGGVQGTAHGTVHSTVLSPGKAEDQPQDGSVQQEGVENWGGPSGTPLPFAEGRPWSCGHPLALALALKGPERMGGAGVGGGGVCKW